MSDIPTWYYRIPDVPHGMTSEAIREQLASGLVSKDRAMDLAHEMKLRGLPYSWPFKKARQRSWNRA
jgi:hypothetical protein